MGTIDYNKIKEISLKQEEMLRFDHFSNKIAWELGSFLVQHVYEKGIDLAISIQKPNGNIIFQHYTEGTTMNNQNWIRRKFNTVVLTEHCSIRMWASINAAGETAVDQGLNPLDYAFCGGGFPIRLKTGEFVGVLLVSNLPHEQDHQFVIEGLQEWLKVEDVPYIEL